LARQSPAQERGRDEPSWGWFLVKKKLRPVSTCNKRKYRSTLVKRGSMTHKNGSSGWSLKCSQGCRRGGGGDKLELDRGNCKRAILGTSGKCHGGGQFGRRTIKGEKESGKGARGGLRSNGRTLWGFCAMKIRRV